MKVVKIEIFDFWVGSSSFREKDLLIIFVVRCLKINIGFLFFDTK